MNNSNFQFIGITWWHLSSFIYSTDISKDEQLPVVFYIHFGAFYSGFSNIIGPDFLIDEDVIVVCAFRYEFV